MGPSTLIGGYGNEARYTLGAGDPETTRAIADRPSEVLSGRPSITSDTVAAYAKASLDLTGGGTTSGVVYPLAVCDLATDFRFRNVGGASAGAIAAALTAAAELGRSSQVLASGLGPGRYRAEVLGHYERQPHTPRLHRLDRHHRLAHPDPGWRFGDRRVPARPALPTRPDELPSSGLRSRSCVARAGHCHCSPSLHLDGSPACSRSP